MRQPYENVRPASGGRLLPERNANMHPEALHRLVVLALLVLSAAGYGCRSRAHAKNKLPDAPYRAAGSAQLEVRPDLFSSLDFHRVGSGTTSVSVVGFGNVTFAPNASYAVRMPFAGTVERVHVATGERIKEGQSLATVRSSEIARVRAEARRLSVTVATEKELVARLDKLIQEGAASTRELLEARARLNTAEAELQGVREALAAAHIAPGAGDRYEVRSTTAGTVLARHVSPGERVSPDAEQPALLIGDPGKLVVRGSFPERDAPALVEGAACRFKVAALGSDEFLGSVTHLVRAIDPRTRTVEAYCKPATLDGRLTADMAARLEIQSASSPHMTVPRGAVLVRRDDRVVLVKQGAGRLERRVVRIGSTIADQVQIIEGLHDGDEVVIKNAVLLDGELDQVL